jgi:hypothetical protein
MKIAYIAHPIGGNPEGNAKKILDIIKQINLTEPNTVPFAPYITDILALDDNDPEQRERGIKNDAAFFSKKTMDEVRLYGDHLSKGMRGEIEFASFFKIPIRPMTKQTRAALERMQKDIGFELEILN